VHFAGMESFTQPSAAIPAPDLDAADDSGRSSTDNITNHTALTFNGTGAPSGSTVSLYRDGVLDTTATAAAGGAWTINTTFPAGDATFAMTARYQNATTGLLSTPSAALNVRVDTQVPATPGIPNLATVSDSGQFNNDNITNLTTPTFTGTVEGSAIVSLRNSTTQIGSTTAPAGGTVSYSVSPSPALSEGIKSINVTQQDVAGNTSSPSSALSVTIDTTPPGVSSAVDLQTASDHGRFSNDNVTNVNTPTFTVSGPELIRLSEGATILADYATPPNVTSPVLSDGSHDISARSVDVAGNTSAQTVPLTVTIDTAVPAQPAAPDMTDATDSGKLNNDNITKFTQPGFTGTIEANARVSLKVDGSAAGTITPSGTTYTAAPISALSDGNRSITITQEDVAGNVSLESPALVVTIDTVAPAAASTPDLPADKDSGASNTDNVTNILSSSLVLAGPELIRLQLNNVTTADYLDPQTRPITYVNDGSYTWRSISVDLAGNTSAASAGLTVNVDTLAPTVTISAFDFLTGQDVRFSFSENVGPTLAVADLTLTNLSTSTTIPSSSIALSYFPNTGTFTFPGFTSGILPDGNYQATLTASGVTDVAGNPLPADPTLSFFVLAGDANHDRKVDFNDLVILAQNYNTTGKNFGLGNFNYDAGGMVDFQDLVILAQRYNTELAPPPPPPAPPVQSAGKPALATVPAGVFSDTQIVRAKPVAAKPVAKPRRR
jgi:hypothetical protein